MRRFFHLLEHMSVGDSGYKIFLLCLQDMDRCVSLSVILENWKGWLSTNSCCSAQTQTRMGCLRKSPEVEFDSYHWLSHLGVRAPYAARRKHRYEANKVWMNTTFISQPAIAKPKGLLILILIIITILHIIITTTSILNLRLKQLRQKYWRILKCINKSWKYTQIFAATKTRQNLLQKIIKYWHLPKIFTHA